MPTRHLASRSNSPLDYPYPLERPSWASRFHFVASGPNRAQKNPIRCCASGFVLLPLLWKVATRTLSFSELNSIFIRQELCEVLKRKFSSFH